MASLRTFDASRRRRYGVALVISVVSGAPIGTGCKCSPSGPTGPMTVYTGTLPGAGIVFHDFPTPPETTQMDVDVQWTPATVAVRFVHGHPDCDPVQTTNC